jgi:hypothetical protein
LGVHRPKSKGQGPTSTGRAMDFRPTTGDGVELVGEPGVHLGGFEAEVVW